MIMWMLDFFRIFGGGILFPSMIVDGVVQLTDRFLLCVFRLLDRFDWVSGEATGNGPNADIAFCRPFSRRDDSDD